MLSEEKIKELLSSRAKNIYIEAHRCVGSTNDIAKEYARTAKGEALIVASEQTAGRGRRGRSFFSPDTTGLYMSVLLRPEHTPEISSLLTTAAAVATAKAIENISQKRADIKWINDIYIDGKKACGILCESALSQNGSQLDHVVVGIGINLCEPRNGFPKEIKDIATSVFGDKCPSEYEVCRLCADIVNKLTLYSDTLSERAFLDEYKKRLFILGKEISVMTPSRDYTAVASDIDENAHLIVTLPDGTTNILSAGEISVKARS